MPDVVISVNNMDLVLHQKRCYYSDSGGSRVVKTEVLLLLLFVFSNVAAAASNSTVETLPGYPAGVLPFKLETGYVSVGEREDVELFYYFVQSERDPETDPLMLWLAGGPGCSAFSGFIYEIGPLTFDFQAFDGESLPKLVLNPYSWTKIANIIFLDSPVGTGFSYATTPEGYYSSATEATQDIYTFLQKWLLERPKFLKNRLYIGGDSYGGMFVPMLTFKIAQGIEAGLNPSLNLQGYVIGNPATDKRIDMNARVPNAHRLALLSDEYYEMARVNCGGEYVNPDPSNAECLHALQLYQQCTRNLYQSHVLEPACRVRSSNTLESESYSSGVGIGRACLEEDDDYSFLRSTLPQSSWCRGDNYVLSYVWANDPAVQQALRVRNGTIKEWKRCNRSLSYDFNVESVVHYHKLLSHQGIQALVYSGDHDLWIPYIGTLQWIRLLNLTMVDDWRPWFVDAQVAGYTKRYINQKSRFHLTFATIKGGGHTAPEYKPKECLAMIQRFFDSFPM